MTLHGMGDGQLLEAFARDRSEAAFAELVGIHLNWVYSVAVREVGDAHMAEDVVQSVFVLLARKAGELRPGAPVNGWLFRATRHVAAHARRSEQRRRLREATAGTMITDLHSPDTGETRWPELAPHLDQAVAALSDADRSAILLRFYEKMPLRTVGERLGVSEEAAKKRVSRALEKLRLFLDRRGVKLGGMALAALLTEKTVQAASVTLAGAVVKTSVAATAAAAPAGLPELARETLRAWHWVRVRLAAGMASGAVVLIFLAVVAGRSLVHHDALPAGAATSALRTEAVTTAPSPNASPVAMVNQQPQPFQKRGFFRGVVVDDHGHPVVGARVWGGFSGAPFAQDATDDAGQFALEKMGLPPFVTVDADGFAADQQEFDPSNVPGPLVFRLNPVPPLKLRVVDEAGQGVAGVAPFVYQWWGRMGTLGQHVPQQTDAEGRLAWLGPPTGEIDVEFGASGYRYSRTNKLVADGEEHMIVLHPTATVTGSVTDAGDGTPVASFRITQGHGQPWTPLDESVLWNLQSRSGNNGAYQAVIEEEQKPYLRIEADGYVTVESEIPLTNGLAAVRDFQLVRQSPVNAIRGTVFLPDGRPAAGVEVALCTTDVGVMLNGTNFAPEAMGNVRSSTQAAGYRRKTDAQGGFTFDPKPRAHTVVAAGAGGLGWARCLAYTSPLEIRLQAWGRIEGTVRTRDRLWANRKVRWQPAGNLTIWMTLWYDRNAYATHSDASGRFVLETVPPGAGRMVLDDADGESGTAPVLSATADVPPGETIHVQIGGAGRKVSGKFVAPPGVVIWSWTNQVTLAQAFTDGVSYNMPPGLTGTAAEQWKLEFADTEAGRAYFRDSCAYPFTVGDDGSFVLPEVLPGKYRLFMNVAHGTPGPGAKASDDPGSPIIAQGGAQFSVPETSADEAGPVNLGEIMLTPQP